SAWSIPLSTTGMEFGIAALGILALLSPLMGESIMGRTPLDGVLLFAAGIFALSSVASGHPLAASVGWLRLWIVVAYFGIFWWLPDAAARCSIHAIARSCRDRCGRVRHRAALHRHRLVSRAARSPAVRSPAHHWRQRVCEPRILSQLPHLRARARRSPGLRARGDRRLAAYARCAAPLRRAAVLDCARSLDRSGRDGRHA